MSIELFSSTLEVAHIHLNMRPQMLPRWVPTPPIQASHLSSKGKLGGDVDRVLTKGLHIPLYLPGYLCMWDNSMTFHLPPTPLVPHQIGTSNTPSPIKSGSLGSITRALIPCQSSHFAQGHLSMSWWQWSQWKIVPNSIVNHECIMSTELIPTLWRLHTPM